MPRSFVLVTAMSLLMLLGLALAYVRQKDHDRVPAALSQGDGLPIYDEVPNQKLIDSSGNERGLDDFKGKVWVVNFMFTSCKGPCPLMSARLRSLGKEFTDPASLHLVSISVDPATDTPAVLSAYAKTYDADPSRWTFLTGEKRAITKLAVGTFKLGAEDATTIHSTRFVLIDQSGRVRGYYDSEAPEQLEKLRDAIKELNLKVAS